MPTKTLKQLRRNLETANARMEYASRLVDTCRQAATKHRLRGCYLTAYDFDTLADKEQKRKNRYLELTGRQYSAIIRYRTKQ